MDRAPGEAFDTVDEGHVQLGVTADVDRPEAPSDADRPLYVHETLATWDGWSLAVPRPGHPIAQDPEVPAAGGDLTSFGLTITTTPVPGAFRGYDIYPTTASRPPRRPRRKRPQARRR